MTQLVTKVGDVIGDWLLGSKKDFKEKIKIEISDHIQKSGKTVKSTAKITEILEIIETSKKYDDDSETADSIVEDKEKKEMVEREGVEMKKKSRREKKKKGYFTVRSDSQKENNLDQDKGKDKVEDADKNKNKNKNKSKDRKTKSAKEGWASRKSSRRDGRDGSPRVIFVCSGE